MKRRRGREYAFQILFQHDFTGQQLGKEEMLEFWQDKDEGPDLKGFVGDIVLGTLEHIKEIDEAIQNAAEHWVMDRMAAADRNILRLAAYELLYRKDIPSVVTINEAIEIAKKFSTAESASFINGILDKIAKGLKNKKRR